MDVPSPYALKRRTEGMAAGLNAFYDEHRSIPTDIAESGAAECLGLKGLKPEVVQLLKQCT